MVNPTRKMIDPKMIWKRPKSRNFMDVVLSYQGFCTENRENEVQQTRIFQPELSCRDESIRKMSFYAETGRLSLTTALPNKKETGAIPCLDHLLKLIPPPDTPTPNHSSRLS